MDLDKFEYIICIAEEKSFTKAAQKLYISQPALSQYVSSIEDQFGIKIFDRKKKPLKLTIAGEVFIEGILEILNLKKGLHRDLENISKNGITSLSIGISVNRSPYFLPIFLPKLKDFFPNLKIKLVEKNSKDLELSLLNGHIDIALISLPLANKGLEYVKFFKEEILLITPREEKYENIKKQKIVKLDQFRDENFILLNSKQKLRNVIENLFLERNFYPNIFLETENQECVLSLVEKGLGIGFSSNLILTTGKWEKSLFSYSLVEKTLTREFVVAYRAKKKLNVVEEKIIEILQKN